LTAPLPVSALTIEHLPADAVGISPRGALALAKGSVGGLTVARKPSEVGRPKDQLDFADREALSLAISLGLASALDGGLDSAPRVRTSLEVLGRPGSFCVVTGQQPGLLGGPLYTLHKAMQACLLARDLSQDWGVPVVPVFWNHGDDHDLAEVNHAWLKNPAQDLQKVRLAGLSSGRLPFSRIPLDREQHRLEPTRALIAQTFEQHIHAEAAVDLLFPRNGETLVRTLTRALTQLLGEHGLIVLEPDWVRPQLSRALSDIIGTDPIPALIEGSGAEPAIDPEAAALVFRVDNKGRRPLRPGGEGFAYDGEAGSRTPAELAAMVLEDQEGWSAGALLRPLVQDAVFPTCAYVGGLGELDYHAQLVVARERAGIASPAFVPRTSITFVDGPTRLSLERCEVDVADILAAKGQFTRGEVLEAPPVIQALDEATERAIAELQSLKGELKALEPALTSSLKRAIEQIRKAADKVQDKAKRVHANRSGKGERHTRRLNTTLYPRGKPQERVLGATGFLAQHGLGLIDALWEELPSISTEHIVVHLPDLEDTPGNPTVE
jgi:bacillithiol synthase